MDTMQKPTHYIKKGGSTWEPWPFGYLNINDLDTHIKDLVALDVFPVVSVKFNDTSIWDVGIGWRNRGGTLVDREVEEDTPYFGESHAIDEKKYREATRILNAGLKPTTSFKKHSIKSGDSLNEAHAIINGDRQDSYGNPEYSFATIAEYWNIYMIARPTTLDEGALTALDVAHMMMLFKLARCSGQQTKRDNYIDIQGYAAIAADRLVKE
jgi:hypothetical protein